MPGLMSIEPHEDLTGAVQQIILSASDSDYLDQLIPLLKNAQTQTHVTPLIHALNHVSADREAEIERICNTNHREFISSVNQLQSVRQGTVSLTAEIMELSKSIEASTEKLAEQKRALVESRSVRQNIDDATQALKDCLEVLRLANQVHDLLGRKNYYAALRALDELQNVHLREVTRYKIAKTIERSVPATQRLIAEAVMANLNTWLADIKDLTQVVGEVAFYHTEMRRDRQKKRFENNDDLAACQLNSAVELVADEPEEFDVMTDENVAATFKPLLECLHIHENLGKMESFRADYAATRRGQKDLLIPQTLNLLDDQSDESNGRKGLSSLLEGIAGFAIIEKATMQKTVNFRSQADVDELWDSMCQAAISLISAALPRVDSDEQLLKIKGIIALFIQTMDSWNYQVSSLDGLLLTIFEKYASLLKQRFSEDFQEIVSTDDYMPMSIGNSDEYAKVVDVSWYNPPRGQESPESISYPCVLPFSQMYPLVCIDIRNFLNQIYLFSDDHFRHTTIIDKTLRDSLDELLVHKVCNSLMERLSSQYLGQIVQILTNLDHFEQACRDLEDLLVEARSTSSAAGPIVLSATSSFRDAKQKTEKRIFELVNSKIDDQIDTAEYDWASTQPPQEVSLYMQELTRYLANIMTSVLLGLPEQMKGVIYREAASHISKALLDFPLEPSVRRISSQAVEQFVMDIGHLVDFVEGLPERDSLIGLLLELRQTTDLMVLATEGGGEEFFDSSKSSQPFSNVDKLKGAELLEKVDARPKSIPQNASLVQDRQQHMKKPSVANLAGDFRDRFGKLTLRDRS